MFNGLNQLEIKGKLSMKYSIRLIQKIVSTDIDYLKNQAIRTNI